VDAVRRLRTVAIPGHDKAADPEVLAAMARHLGIQDAEAAANLVMKGADEERVDFPHACADPPGLVGGIAAITAASGRSREHCARSIRSHLGRSAGELVRDLRCDWLARQLRLGDTPFAELCAELGAANVAHLHRHFRRRFGHTPGDYRRRLRGVARAEPRRTGG